MPYFFLTTLQDHSIIVKIPTYYTPLNILLKDPDFMNPICKYAKQKFNFELDYKSYNKNPGFVITKTGNGIMKPSNSFHDKYQRIKIYIIFLGLSVYEKKY